jgi:transcriptional regulator with XRE-family HTH domain
MAALSDSPARARRLVRYAVRRARDAKGFTQSDVAEQMEWSLSKVMRIESGEVTITPNDLRPLLNYLGIKDRAEVDSLIAAAKVSRQRVQSKAPGFMEYGTTNMRHLMELEHDATAYRSFLPMIIPGWMQTPDYARAVLGAFSASLSEETITGRLQIRAERRRVILERDNPPKCYVLLDEGVLLRKIGGGDVLRGQLLEILDIIQRGRAAVRVIPFDQSDAVSMLATFEILYLAGEDDNSEAVLYRESDILDELVDDEDKIRRHREIFDRLWAAARDQDASAAMIEDQAKQLAQTADFAAS